MIQFYNMYVRVLKKIIVMSKDISSPYPNLKCRKNSWNSYELISEINIHITFERNTEFKFWRNSSENVPRIFFYEIECIISGTLSRTIWEIVGIVYEGIFATDVSTVKQVIFDNAGNFDIGGPTT